MTSLRLAIALLASTICIAIAAAKGIQLAGEARDPGVSHWISYEILGPQNHPLPIVYLSTQPFKTMADENLVVLPPARYNIISAYTRARVERPDCPGEIPRGNIWYTVKIAEHHKKLTQSCVLPQALACDYLSGVLKLSETGLTVAERRPIVAFMAEVKCATGSRDDLK